MNFLKNLLFRYEFRVKKYRFTIVHRLGNKIVVFDYVTRKRCLQDAYEFIFNKWPDLVAVERRRFLWWG